MTAPHILIVDDTLTNLQLAEAYLDEANVTVTTATSGEEALALTEQHLFNAIYMDIEMPGLGGLATASIIRQTHTMPIIAMTAHSQQELKKDLQKHGVNGFLAKPFNDTSLIQSVSKYCDADTVTIRANATSHQATALDIAGVRKRLRNNHELIRRIFEGFIQNNTNTYQNFCDAVDTEDWNTAKRMAHTLKGGGGNIGATRLCNYCETLEKLCSAQERPAENKLHALERELNNTFKACQQELASLPTPRDRHTH